MVATGTAYADERIVFLEFAVFMVLFAILGLVVGICIRAAVAWHGPDLLRRALLLALVPLAAALSAVPLVILATLISACQAYAYRAIAADRAEARPA